MLTFGPLGRLNMSDFDKNEVIELSSNDYKKESTSLGFGNIVPLIIPLAVVYSSSKGKNKTNNSDISSDSLPEKKDFEIIEKSEQLVGTLTNAIDIMKKVNKINSIRTSSGGLGSVEGIHEAFSVFKDLFSDSTHIDRINSLESTITTIKKFSDVRKILDTATSADTSSVEKSVVKTSSKPMLSSEESNESMNGLEKIVKMANIISSLSKEMQ